MRYGKNEMIGYYSSHVRDNPAFTWYYIEPESGIYLFGPKTLISKNKVTAVLELISMDPLYKKSASQIDPNIRIHCSNLSETRKYLLTQVSDLLSIDKPVDEDLLCQKEKIILVQKQMDDTYSINNYLEVIHGDDRRRW